MIAYTDENGHRQVVRGSPDKAVTREIAVALENKVRKFKNGVITPADDKYIEQGDPPKRVAHLQRAGRKTTHQYTPWCKTPRFSKTRSIFVTASKCSQLRYDAP